MYAASKQPVRSPGHAGGGVIPLLRSAIFFLAQHASNYCYRRCYHWLNEDLISPNQGTSQHLFPVQVGVAAAPGSGAGTLLAFLATLPGLSSSPGHGHSPQLEERHGAQSRQASDQ